jgi:hypothetical protein
MRPCWFPSLDLIEWAYRQYKEQACRRCHTPPLYLDVSRQGYEWLRYEVLKFCARNENAAAGIGGWNPWNIGPMTIFGMEVRIVECGYCHNREVFR